MSGGQGSLKIIHLGLAAQEYRRIHLSIELDAKLFPARPSHFALQGMAANHQRHAIASRQPVSAMRTSSGHPTLANAALIMLNITLPALRIRRLWRAWWKQTQGTSMRLKLNAILNYIMSEPVDVLLAIEAADLSDQRLIEHRLKIVGVGPLRPIEGGHGIGRRTWMRAEGSFQASYHAIVDVSRTAEPIDYIPLTSRRELPADVIPYLWPSRYCEADRFEAFVTREFAQDGGGARILAMVDWIHEHVDYRRGTSDGTTTAVDVFVSRQGVCRDFSHLLVSFARAAGIPARLVSAYAWNLDPPDFHAVVEVWLGEGWHLIDPSKLVSIDGVVRIAVGRDATDVAFMTIFGCADMVDQVVRVARLDSV